MSKECARSLRKECGGHAAGPAAHIDEHPVVDSLSERMLMGLLRMVPVWVRAYHRPLVRNHLFTARPASRSFSVEIPRKCSPHLNVKPASRTSDVAIYSLRFFIESPVDQWRRFPRELNFAWTSIDRKLRDA